jgi:zinc transport system ATP-binding protein
LMVTHDLQPILNKAGRLICIHRKLTSLLPEQICTHYSLGLYHSPSLPLVVK